jgi:hypothetical protein
MPPGKKQNYTRFPVGKYTAALKKHQDELTERLVAENKKVKAKQARLKRLQDKVSSFQFVSFGSLILSIVFSNQAFFFT